MSTEQILLLFYDVEYFRLRTLDTVNAGVISARFSLHSLSVNMNGFLPNNGSDSLSIYAKRI